MQPTIERASQAISAEGRLQELAIHLPVPPEPFGTYTEAVHLGSLDRVKRIVRLGVSVATDGNIRDQSKVADGASDFLQEVLAQTKLLRAWCMESRVFHLEPCRRGADI
jgi:hypothetical protein